MAQKVPTGYSIYLDQLVKTATNGNVSVGYALHVNRMQLHCKVCDMTLTAAMLDAAAEMDYSVGEWIKIHAHTGGHKDPACLCTAMIDGGLHAEDCPSHVVQPTPITADFKKVETAKALKEKVEKMVLRKATGRKFR